MPYSFDFIQNSEAAAKDLNLPLGGVPSDTSKLKQLASPLSRTMVVSPLSKLAKGMQNIGLNLDPRKITTKVSNRITFQLLISGFQ